MTESKPLAFVVDWFDRHASQTRAFHLFFYPDTNQVEMTRRTFLKKCDCPLRKEDLYKGSYVTVYARQLKVVDFADDATRRELAGNRQSTLALVKPEAHAALGQILTAAASCGLNPVHLRSVSLSAPLARRFIQYFSSGDDTTGPQDLLVRALSCGPVIAIELAGDDCIQRWKELCGSLSNPSSLRGQFGKDRVRNAVHASDSPDAAKRELDFFFGTGANALQGTAHLDGCSLCLIKPHALQAGQAGAVIEALMAEGIDVSAAELFSLDGTTAAEFLEVYKGVVPEYTSMVDQLTAGPCLAMETRCEDAVNTLRALAGPSDPEVARALRPGTLRARFGVDKARNAVHVTDLPEDGALESEYFFKILQLPL